jgi:hypothetical protein
MKQFLFFLLGTALIAAAGCASAKSAKRTLGYGEKPANYKFEKIKDAKLELVFAGPKTLKAGSPGQVSFALKNVGKKIVSIEEWRMHEQDNLKLECQIWLPGQQEPDPDRWLSLDLPVKQPELRYHLELYPGNQALVTKNLDFVESLVITPGAERRYFIRASLNLTSVKSNSPVAAIAITPAN